MATVLVVDDDPLATEVVRATLVNAGYDVHTHDSGFGLAVTIHRLQPDVVVLDVNMPGLSGSRALEAASGLDERYQLDTRVLLHSGMAEAELLKLAKEVGAHGAVVKPARLSVLADAVATGLQQPRRRLGRA